MDIATISVFTDQQRQEFLAGLPHATRRLLVWDRITAAAAGSAYLHPNWIADYVNANYSGDPVVHMEFEYGSPSADNEASGIIAVTIWLMQ